jgi:hypothetical protein
VKALACLLLVVGVVTAPPSAAQTSGFEDPLLDRLVGDWVLEGTIDGKQVTHDLTAEWVLGYYLRFHEVDREVDESGKPAYEAIVFIGWDTPNDRYACLWLDNTGGEGLSNGVIGYAIADGDTIPFEFAFPDGSLWYTTFSYDRAADAWSWHMIGEGEDAEAFAQVTLRRR